jgi:hypothetical protein
MVDVVGHSYPLDYGSAYGLSGCQSCRSSFYGPFDSPTDFHPFALPTDWEDVRQSEQCEPKTNVVA